MVDHWSVISERETEIICPIKRIDIPGILRRFPEMGVPQR